MSPPNQNEIATWREVTAEDGTIHMLPPNGGHVPSMDCPCRPSRGQLPGPPDSPYLASHYDGPLMVHRLLSAVQDYMAASEPEKSGSAYWDARCALDAIRAVYRKSDSSRPPCCPECHEELPLIPALPKAQHDEP